MDGANPQESYFQKSANISAIVQRMSVLFVSRQSRKSSEKGSGKSLRYGLLKILQNRHIERSLFTILDPAPLIINADASVTSIAPMWLRTLHIEGAHTVRNEAVLFKTNLGHVEDDEESERIAC